MEEGYDYVQHLDIKIFFWHSYRGVLRSNSLPLTRYRDGTNQANSSQISSGLCSPPKSQERLFDSCPTHWGGQPCQREPSSRREQRNRKGPIQSPIKAATTEKGKEPEPECSPEKPIVISSDSSEGYTPLSDNESVGYFPWSENKSEGYTPLDHAESDECTSLYFPEEWCNTLVLKR